MTDKLGTCEDGDPACPHCHGHCQKRAIVVLYRIDMGDLAGTAMCEDCCCDAMDSGLFDTREEDNEPH